jgi:hypothetical protein
MVAPVLWAGHLVVRGGLSCDLIQVRILAERKHQNAAKIKNAAIKSVDHGVRGQFGACARRNT